MWRLEVYRIHFFQFFSGGFWYRCEHDKFWICRAQNATLVSLCKGLLVPMITPLEVNWTARKVISSLYSYLGPGQQTVMGHNLGHEANLSSLRSWTFASSCNIWQQYIKDKTNMDYSVLTRRLPSFLQHSLCYSFAQNSLEKIKDFSSFVSCFVAELHFFLFRFSSGSNSRPPLRLK